ncbi:HAD family hydrolase [Brevibacillus sp. TJ4]|uniref:HAD family hydrolase n=1 Tax=Brevibacillus sp. TJ4 TaxID=3234853 RepID=UPI003BA0F1FF
MGLTPKLAAFDMDGTLLNKDSQMTQATKEACLALREQGCKLVLSTGRTYGSAQIPIDAFPFDGFVCSNGAAILEADGSLVRKTLLPQALIDEVIAMLRQEVMYYELHDTASNRWMIEEDRTRLAAMLADSTDAEDIAFRNYAFYKLARTISLQEIQEKMQAGQIEILKVFMWHRDPERLQWLRQQWEPWADRLTLTSSGRHNLEMIGANVSKWEGLRYFREKWGIAPEQVMAFGDAENDREALSNAGYAVAMENAAPQIKQLAGYIAPHHDEDGVARFIMQQVIAKQ